MKDKQNTIIRKNKNSFANIWWRKVAIPYMEEKQKQEKLFAQCVFGENKPLKRQHNNEG